MRANELTDKARSVVVKSRENACLLPEAAVGRASKCAHEIVQFLKRERFFQNSRSRHKSESLFGILLMQGLNKFGASGAGTAYEFQSNENKIVGSLVAVHAGGLGAVRRQSN